MSGQTASRAGTDLLAGAAAFAVHPAGVCGRLSLLYGGAGVHHLYLYLDGGLSADTRSRVPMYYRQYRYSVGGMMVRVSRGVIYNQVDAVYIRNLQYTTLSQNLLQRLMNLATLRLYAAGGVVRIENISYEEARLLRIQLGRRMEADDGTDLD